LLGHVKNKNDLLIELLPPKSDMHHNPRKRRHDLTLTKKLSKITQLSEFINLKFA